MILKVTSRIARWSRLLFLPILGCSCTPLSYYKLLISCLISLNLLFIPVCKANALELTSDTKIATAGFFQLKWTGPALLYQLQESPTPDFSSFKTLYQGSDLATVLSGKANGDYYYRVVMNHNQQKTNSNVVKVSVLHHSLFNAFLFFIAGAVVFLALLIVIIRGNRQLIV